MITWENANNEETAIQALYDMMGRSGSLYGLPDIALIDHCLTSLGPEVCSLTLRVFGSRQKNALMCCRSIKVLNGEFGNDEMVFQALIGVFLVNQHCEKFFSNLSEVVLSMLNSGLFTSIQKRDLFGLFQFKAGVISEATYKNTVLSELSGNSNFGGVENNELEKLLRNFIDGTGNDARKR
jgi:hypothetical protein